MNTSYKAVTEQYNYWLDTLSFSASSVVNYTTCVKDFFCWLDNSGVSQINKCTTKLLYTYFEYLQSRPNKRRKGGLSTSYLNDNFIAIDKLMEFLNQMGVRTAPAPTNFRILPDKQARINKIEPFTQDEIKTLQAQIPNSFTHLPFIKRERIHEQLKLVFALYYGCGLRRSEGYKLQVKDIDFDKKTIFIRQGKNYKDRIVPINDRIYEALQHYIYNYRNLQKTRHKRLFINTTGTLNNHLQDLNKLVKIDKRITLHILRHSIATHLLQNGMSIENIARFLGHSTLDSTQIYTHIVYR